jgi:glucokinase
MPGRDQNNILDMLGIGLIFAAIGGVFIHGGIRFMKRK